MISLNIATEVGCVNCIHNKVCKIANNLNRQIEIDDVPISISVKLSCDHHVKGELKMSKPTILREDECNEEWWQPELHCEECNCTFMWSSYPNFPEYPKFCPNCGKQFTALRKGKCLIVSAIEDVKI